MSVVRDDVVYRALSLAAIRYGGGLHAKHRLTRYHWAVCRPRR